MLSFKRFVYIILIVVVIGALLLLVSFFQNHSPFGNSQEPSIPERQFTASQQVDAGDKPRIWLIGAADDERYGALYRNVLQLFEDLHMSVMQDRFLNSNRVEENDLVVLCDSSLSSCADSAALERLVAQGGRVICAAGLTDDESDAALWPLLGIQKKEAAIDCHEVTFEQPLLPLQPEHAYFSGMSRSAQIEVYDDVVVYMRDEASGTPLLHTALWQEGSICLINGSFLADPRYVGLLTGALGALLPDFVYPVLGVKTAFLDNFAAITANDDELYLSLYGYSAEGFIENEVWPAFQGLTLRTGTPFTASVVVEASSKDELDLLSENLLTDIGRPLLQFGGELAYASNCHDDDRVIMGDGLIDQVSSTFAPYTVRSLALQTTVFSSPMLRVPHAEIQAVRGILDDEKLRFSWNEEYFVFPAATAGSSFEDGDLFAVCSVIGAYGMISHVFDIDGFDDPSDVTTSWDANKKQIGLFESDVFAQVPWLEGRTLIQTRDDVKSYVNMDYGWVKEGDCLKLSCSDIAYGQAFFYHTDSRIVGVEGMSYQDVGNGYYLVRMQGNEGFIMLETSE